MQSIGHTTNPNKLFIAAAGAGKTTKMVEEALSIQSGNVLLTTYTDSNAEAILSKIWEKVGYIPSNITVLTWFTFLLNHGVRPYQSTLNTDLENKRIGFLLTDHASGTFISNGQVRSFGAEKYFFRHYFTNGTSLKIYSDKIAKFVVDTDSKLADKKASYGELISRVSRIFSHIYIDEVQDLAGWDLELLKRLMYTHSNIIMYGDPRQVTYLTHHPKKYTKYMNGGIASFIVNECEKGFCDIDPVTLNVSHRNNREICDFSNKLFPDLVPTKPCNCSICSKAGIEHQGIYIVKKSDADKYIEMHKPVTLKWQLAIMPEWNFGKSKGMTFDRVLIYPTHDISKWIFDNKTKLEFSTRCKFYVAITRAKFSVGLVIEDSKIANIPKDTLLWNSK